jgi:hypothetical protein
MATWEGGCFFFSNESFFQFSQKKNSILKKMCIFAIEMVRETNAFLGSVLLGLNLCNGIKIRIL